VSKINLAIGIIMLSDQHISIVKSTIPLLEDAGSALTNYFYKRMFKNNPEVKHIFNLTNQETGRQQFALFEAIANYAKHIEDLAHLSSAVERISQKHTSFNIQPAHYQIVGHHLIETLRELAPDAFTSDVEEAWTEAYIFLASIFIGREKELYHQRQQADGGWEGKRVFKVASKVQESELVTSFTFVPVDGKSVLTYNSGQYLGVEVMPLGTEYTEIRQYSISQAANDVNYRISVKKELGGDNPQGLVSNHLHNEVNEGDEINLYAPAGDFFFTDNNSPVVLISAGVGITPMQSMLESFNKVNYQQDVHFYHACEGEQQHSFDKHNQQICDKQGWQYKVWYLNEQSKHSHKSSGLMHFECETLPRATGHFYICGPIGFMKFAKQALLDQGVDGSRIHYEIFGPHESL